MNKTYTFKKGLTMISTTVHEDVSADAHATAGDYFFVAPRPDSSQPAEASEDVELEEYASPT